MDGCSPPATHERGVLHLAATLVIIRNPENSIHNYFRASGFRGWSPGSCGAGPERFRVSREAWGLEIL